VAGRYLAFKTVLAVLSGFFFYLFCLQTARSTFLSAYINIKRENNSSKGAKNYLALDNQQLFQVCSKYLEIFFFRKVQLF
jgi:hypothetical protein